VSEIDRLLELNRQIERDLRPVAKPAYGRLVVGVLASTAVGVAGVAFLHLDDHARGASGSSIPPISQAYQREEHALQHYRTLAQQLSGAVPTGSVNP
jgi:hypothetical protein